MSDDSVIYPDNLVHDIGGGGSDGHGDGHGDGRDAKRGDGSGDGSGDERADEQGNNDDNDNEHGDLRDGLGGSHLEEPDEHLEFPELDWGQDYYSIDDDEPSLDEIFQ